MTSMKASQMYRFNNSAEFGSNAWTWLHQGCNDDCLLTFEGIVYPEIVTKACTHFTAEGIEFNGSSPTEMLVAIGYWAAVSAREVESDLEPVITRNMDRTLYSLSDRVDWIDPTTLPGGDNNIEDNLVQREFSQQLRHLLGL